MQGNVVSWTKLWSALGKKSSRNSNKRMPAFSCLLTDVRNEFRFLVMMFAQVIITASDIDIA